jgi:hypothetical protein
MKGSFNEINVEILDISDVFEFGVELNRIIKLSMLLFLHFEQDDEEDAFNAHSIACSFSLFFSLFLYRYLQLFSIYLLAIQVVAFFCLE